MRLSFFLIITVLQSFFQYVTAQETWVYSRFSVVQGLISNQVKDVLRDKKGFVWAATTFGLQRYDGIRFTSVPAAGGKHYMPVTLLREDSRGNIWFLMGEGQLTTVNFTGSGYVGDTAAAETFRNDTIRMYDLGPGDEVVALNRRGQLLLADMPSAHIQRFNIQCTNIRTRLAMPASNRIILMEARRLRIYDVSGRPGSRTLKLLHDGIAADDNTFFQDMHYQRSTGRLRLFVKNTGFRGRLAAVLYTGQEYIASPPATGFFNAAEVNNCSEKDDSTVLLHSINGLIQYHISTGQTTRVFLKGLDEEQGHAEQVHVVFTDAEQNVWLCPSSGGILLVKSTRFAITTWRLPEPGRQRMHIRCCWYMGSGRLLLGIEGRGLFEARYNRPEQPVQLRPVITGTLRVNAVFTDPAGCVWAGIDQYIYQLPRNGTVRRFATGAAWCINMDSSGVLWAGTQGNGIYRWSGNNFESFYRPVQIPLSTYGNTGVVWRLLHYNQWLVAATDSGIIMLDKTTGRLARHKAAVELHRQTSSGVYWGLCGETGHTALVAGQNQKLKRLHLNTGNVDVLFTEAIGFFNVLKDTSQVFWITTDRGVLRFEPASGSAMLYGLEDNLVSLNLGYLASHHLPGNRLLFAGTGGFSIINPAMLPAAAPASPVITGFEVFNNRNYNYLESGSRIQLKYSHNSFRVQFASPHILTGAAPYEYMLEGYDAGWNRADKSAAATYSHLPPRNYRLLVRLAARSPNQTGTTSVWIHVTTPYWKTAWFRLAIITAALLAAGLPLWLRYRYRRDKNRKRMQLQEMELKTLRTQLNPHFIFNALNSIQYFMIKNDKEAANNYLSRFSVLMRSVLQSSRLPVISVAAEADLLRRYLEIETLRFNGQISWDVTVREGTNPEAGIASMMIQPVAENAVIHGLMPKGGQGRIGISFWQEDDYICCTVTDNGAGRREQPRQAVQRQPSGLAMLQERIVLMNRMYNKKGSIELLFLFEQQQPAGARVTLRLPVIDTQIKKP